jgi:outer membrane receptor for ferrienterochelin and colicins
MHWRRLLIALILAGLSETVPVYAQAPEDRVNRLDEMVVTGTRTSHTLKDVPVETVVVTREDIERTNAQTVTDAIRHIPGMSAAGADDLFGAGSSTARLHGLSFNNGYGLILIDGQRIHGSGQSGAHGEYAVGLNQIPVSMIERVEVVKGPSSVLYGSDAMVGVINIITRKSPKKETGGAGATYGWYKVKERVRDGKTSKPSDDGELRNLSESYVNYGGRISDRTGYLINYAYESAENNGADPTEEKRNSGMVKIDSRLSDSVDGWLKGELSDYIRDGASPSTEDSYRVSAALTWQPSDSHLLQLKGYHYVDFFSAESSASQRYGNIGFDQMELQHTWKLTANQLVTTGAEFQRQTIDYLMDNNDGTNVSRTTVKEDVDTWSVFFQDEMNLYGDFTMVPGIRYDHHSTFDESINPKFSLMYRVFGATTLRASVGRSFKSPTIRQLYYDVPFYHSPFYIRSNPDLAPETSIGYSVSVEQWLFNNNIILNLGFFRNDIDDMVVTENTGEMYYGQELRIYRNVEKAMTQGIEFSARMQFGRYFLVSAAYAYTDSENKDTGEGLTYIPEHEVSLAPTFEYEPFGLGIGANMAWFSRQYTRSDHSAWIDEHGVVDAKVYKKLGRSAKLTLEADNVFDSDKGDERNYRTGQVFIVKLDIDF